MCWNEGEMPVHAVGHSTLKHAKGAAVCFHSLLLHQIMTRSITHCHSQERHILTCFDNVLYRVNIAQVCNNLPLSLHPVIKPSLIPSYFSQRFWALVDLILFIIINICIVTNIAFHNHIMSGCFHWHGVLNLSFKI